MKKATQSYRQVGAVSGAQLSTVVSEKISEIEHHKDSEEPVQLTRKLLDNDSSHMFITSADTLNHADEISRRHF